CFFAEADPVWVSAELEPGFESYGTTYTGDGGQDPARDPGANIYIGFANGVRAWISDWKGDVRDTHFKVVGSSGMLTIGSAGLTQLSPGPYGLRAEHRTPLGSVSGIEAAVRELTECMRTGRPTSSSPSEARRTVSVLVGCLRSQAAGNIRVHLA